MTQGGSHKLLLTTKESKETIVSSSIFSGPPCRSSKRHPREAIWKVDGQAHLNIYMTYSYNFIIQ